MPQITILDANGNMTVVQTLPKTGQAPGSLSLPVALANDAGLQPQSSAAPVCSAVLETSHVLKASSGQLLSLSAVIGATSGYLMLFDVTTVPADGPVLPKWTQYIASSGGAGTLTQRWAPGPPLYFASGIVVVFSSTGPFTKTSSATAYFSAQVL